MSEVNKSEHFNHWNESVFIMLQITCEDTKCKIVYITELQPKVYDNQRQMAITKANTKTLGRMNAGKRIHNYRNALSDYKVSCKKRLSY